MVGTWFSSIETVAVAVADEPYLSLQTTTILYVSATSKSNPGASLLTSLNTVISIF